MKYWFTRIAPSSSVAARTSSRSSHAWRRSALRRPALAEEQDVDDDVGAGVRAEAALWQADRGDEVRHAGDVLAGARIGLVHRAGAGDERRQPPGFKPIDRLDDEVVMEPQAERAESRSLRTVRSEKGGLPIASRNAAAGRPARNPR